MTEETILPITPRSNRRSQKTPAWKSALLASALGTVILGWGILGCTETPADDQAEQQVTPSSTFQETELLADDSDDGIVLEDDEGDDEDAPASKNTTTQSIPQAPTFRQPPARTRGS